MDKNISCEPSFCENHTQLIETSQLSHKVEDIHDLNSQAIATSCNAKLQTTEMKKVKSQLNQSIETMFNDNLNYQNYFSSPELQINNINHPDVWDALIALEQELSPFDERDKTLQEQDIPRILSRLSQKFKETPTKFTEKLVSIIEDSIVASESPIRHSTTDTSGISLSRMTGEFRKLCKFIEDESMPEWAPSLINATTLGFDKHKSPDKKSDENKEIALKNVLNRMSSASALNQNTACKLLDSLNTPKNKLMSNVYSPIKKFSPSADKSFEYWEKVCDMMCDSQINDTKRIRRSLSVPESTKKSMTEMLTICERQMASLDDSIIDVRNSDPCNKLDNNLNFIQAPRSKSECRLSVNLNVAKKQILDEKFHKLEFKEILTANNNPKTNLNHNYFESPEKNVELMENMKKDCHNFLNTSQSCEYRENDATNDEDQDCSFLIELAKRRQRCLDTAKLMMEIDQEDPSPSSDNKCLETLYKLGVQDKTLIDNKEDATFLNTLGHCFEYKKYFRDKSEPLLKVLQNICSPKATTVEPRKLSSHLKPRTPAPNNFYQQQQQPVSAKIKSTLHSESKCRSTSLHDIAKTPRLAPKALSKTSQKLNSTPSLKRTPCIEKKTLPLSNSQQVSKPIAGKKILSRLAPKQQQQNSQTVKNNSLKQQHVPCKKVKAPLVKSSRMDQKAINLQPAENCSSKILVNKPIKLGDEQVVLKTTNTKTPVPTLQEQQQQHAQYKKVKTPLEKTPRLDKKVIDVKTTEKLSPKILVDKAIEQLGNKQVASKTPKDTQFMKTPVSTNDKNDMETGCPNNLLVCSTQELPLKPRYFLTPGKTPTSSVLPRKKPKKPYFSDFTIDKPVALNSCYDGIKSPINMYIHGMDSDLIQNVKGRTEDLLLTPISNQDNGKSPRLRMKLSPSKENKSPFTYSDENKISTIRYQSADKVRLIDDKLSYSPCSLTPNSRTKKLLEPIENTVVIRHEGRVIEYNRTSDQSNSETSIRVQKMAEKTPTKHTKCT
ncbi:uncharacterized protein LOC106640062 isoform X2 [Copidosoma floridanum]|nr:uncharacterized protein LOC106640062 isoform X2 [Copidosoma floridanum]